MAFLDLIFDHRKELISFLQRAIGYSLTGDISEQVLLLLYGVGSNGKSTLLEIIRLILGDYALNTPFSTFLMRDNETVRNDLARLVGARFVSSIEVKASQRLDEAVVKQLTGGDTITARFLYREYFEFVPCFKLWLAVNHKPVIRGTEEAIWRRIRLIPFEVIIPERVRDKKFPLKLQSELSGILRWALQGCLDWQDQGLDAPEEVIQATASYRSEMDILGNFLAEYVVHTPGAKLGARELYEQYCSWCEKEGEKAISSVWFSRNLHDRGFKAQRTTGGKRQWLEVEFSDGILP
jgi:putative DNA primase/helicase